MSHLKKCVKELALEKWKTCWNQAKQGQQYARFAMNPGIRASKDLELADRLTFSTYTQLKLGHDYFKSYLCRLPAYENDLCMFCEKKQSPEHLLLSCKQLSAERRDLREAIRKEGTLRNEQLTLQMLLCTKVSVKHTLNFLKTTRIATRRWILGNVREEEEEIEWEEIERGD